MNDPHMMKSSMSTYDVTIHVNMMKPLISTYDHAINVNMMKSSMSAYDETFDHTVHGLLEWIRNTQP